jgi:CHAT domain-containing protein
MSKIREYEKRIFLLQARYIELLKEFEEKYPKYYHLRYQMSTADPGRIQKLLDGETAFVEYVVADSILYSFLISGSDFRIVASPLDTGFIDTVDRYYRTIQQRTLIKNPSKVQFWRDSRKIYNSVMHPIEHWTAAYNKLIIVPDPLLANVSFETLADTDSSYLIYDYTVSYHYSATLFLDSITNGDSFPQNGFAGFAPVFDPARNNGALLREKSDLFDLNDPAFTMRSIETRYLRFVPLYESEREINMIIELFDRYNLPSRGYLHEDASERNLKTIEEQQYLHIATHGFFNKENPSYSGLAFSQPSDSMFAEDGILYAREIFNMDLNCNLVVLSSCESGAGKVVRGEGNMALTRGFLFAGVPNMVFSLWKVNDKYTSLLMIEFYRQVLAGRGYDEALREAKLKLLRDEKSALPNHWGAFLLIGQI